MQMNQENAGEKGNQISQTMSTRQMKMCDSFHLIFEQNI
jgi:hypothetical protein